MHRSRNEPLELAVSSRGPMPNLTTRRDQPVADDRPDGLLESAWGILRRRWPVVLLTIILTTGLVLAYSFMQEEQYTASANLLFGTPSETILATGGSGDPNRRAATNEGLLGLGIVAEAASERLNGRISAAAIADSISVVSDPAADLMTVRATTGDPELSAALANAYSSAFIAFRQRSQREQIQDAIDLAEESQAMMSREQRRGEEGEALRERINQLETAQALQTGGAELVQPAVAPTEPSSPKIMRNGILAVVLGSVMGFGLAALRDRWDRGIKTVEGLESASGWPVLARIPTSRPLSRGAELSPRAPEAEAFRLLRASLRYFRVSTDLRSLLITSARSGEGKSTTARRLAETMAAMGDRVVLVEADMHRVQSAESALEYGGRGLSGFLIGLDLDEVLVEMPVDDRRSLAILPSGPLPPNPSELLESERMRELMERLEERFDMVIVDSPPLPVLSDAITLLGHVSGVIVVTALDTTTREDIRDVSQQLSLLGGFVLGLVANFVPPSQQTENYYGQKR